MPAHLRKGRHLIAEKDGQCTMLFLHTLLQRGRDRLIAET